MKLASCSNGLSSKGARYFGAFTLLLACGSVLPACESESCDAVYYYRSVTLTRDLAISFEEISKVTFHTCVEAQCVDATPVDGELGQATPPPTLLSGKITRNSDGTSHLSAVLTFGEGGPEPTSVTVKATSESGNVVLDYSGTIHWREDEEQSCHSLPVETSL